MGGPLDGCTFSLEEDDISGQPTIVTPEGQDTLWLLASFDEGGDFVRFLLAPHANSTAWKVIQYRSAKVGRYDYAGVLVQPDGISTAADIIRKLKGES